MIVRIRAEIGLPSKGDLVAASQVLEIDLDLGVLDFVSDPAEFAKLVEPLRVRPLATMVAAMKE